MMDAAPLDTRFIPVRIRRSRRRRAAQRLGVAALLVIATLIVLLP